MIATSMRCLLDDSVTTHHYGPLSLSRSSQAFSVWQATLHFLVGMMIPWVALSLMALSTSIWLAAHHHQASRRCTLQPAIDLKTASLAHQLVSESALGLRSAGSRRPSIGSQTSSFDQEEQGLRWRAQLRELLNDPSPSPARPEARDLKQSLTFDSPSCAPEMTPAPVIPPLPTSTASACLARSSTISRASTAAMAAERARAAAMNNGSPTSPSTPSSKNRDAAQPLSPGSQPPYSRPAYTRMESSESLRSKTSATTTSGLTWSLRMHEQRA